MWVNRWWRFLWNFFYGPPYSFFHIRRNFRQPSQKNITGKTMSPPHLKIAIAPLYINYEPSLTWVWLLSQSFCETPDLQCQPVCQLYIYITSKLHLRYVKCWHWLPKSIESQQEQSNRKYAMWDQCRSQIFVVCTSCSLCVFCPKK